MTKDRSAPQPAPFWSVRIVEWSLLAAVIVLLVLLFARQVRVIQGQGELAAVKSTLGALRTALVLDGSGLPLDTVMPVPVATLVFAIGPSTAAGVIVPDPARREPA